MLSNIKKVIVILYSKLDKCSTPAIQFKATHVLLKLAACTQESYCLNDLNIKSYGDNVICLYDKCYPNIYDA